LLKSVDGDADMKEVGERFRVVGRESVFGGRGLSGGRARVYFVWQMWARLKMDAMARVFIRKMEMIATHARYSPPFSYLQSANIIRGLNTRNHCHFLPQIRAKFSFLPRPDNLYHPLLPTPLLGLLRRPLGAQQQLLGKFFVCPLSMW